MFQLDKKEIIPQNYAKLSEVMKLLPGSKRYVCIGVYLDENDQEHLFVPKMTLSVFHGDKELIGDVDTIGFVDIPLGKLPTPKNGPSGFSTDERGKYIFYTALDDKEVKIYTNASTLVPEGAKAYKVVNGFLPNDSISQFSSIGKSSHSRNEELLSKKIDGKILKLLE